MNVTDLRGTFFLDTNVLIYSFDASAPQKQEVAREIIQYAIQTQRGMVSTQIVQEFLNIVLQKFVPPLSSNDARAYLQTVLLPLCRHFPSISFYDQTISIQVETGYAWYDALVVTAAIDSGCATLLSEDLQHNRKIRALTIINPFI